MEAAATCFGLQGNHHQGACCFLKHHIAYFCSTLLRVKYRFWMNCTLSGEDFVASFDLNRTFKGDNYSALNFPPFVLNFLLSLFTDVTEFAIGRSLDC
jgi:hypothetical protein